jgi:hypothetical protein
MLKVYSCLRAMLAALEGSWHKAMTKAPAWLNSKQQFSVQIWFAGAGANEWQNCAGKLSQTAALLMQKQS